MDGENTRTGFGGDMSRSSYNGDPNRPSCRGDTNRPGYSGNYQRRNEVVKQVIFFLKYLSLLPTNKVAIACPSVCFSITL